MLGAGLNWTGSSTTSVRTISAASMLSFGFGSMRLIQHTEF